MFATDPTLYRATFPQREYPFVNPYFNQFGTPFLTQFSKEQLPWMTYGQQIPWMQGNQQIPWMQGNQQFPWMQGNQQFPWMQGKMVPPIFQSEFMPQFPSFGNRYIPQLPYGQFSPGLYDLPQYKWQLPYAY